MIIHRNWMVKISLAMQETWVWSLGQEDSLEWKMTTHSSILAWRIPMDRGAGGLQSMGSQRVGHDWVTKHNIHRNQAAEIKTRHVRPTPRLGVDASLYFPFSKTDMRRRQWHPTPVLFCLENRMDRGAWQASVHGVAKSRTRLSNLTFTFHFHALGKEMAIHSSVLAWRIPGAGEPGGLLSMGLHRVGHDWSDLAAAANIG